jgi:hypothetical protein
LTLAHRRGEVALDLPPDLRLQKMLRRVEIDYRVHVVNELRKRRHFRPERELTYTKRRRAANRRRKAKEAA